MATRIATTLPYTELEVATGNFDTSRASIDRIIIHTMVGTVQGAAAKFDNPTSQVSAHYGVGLDGKLYHWLEETFTAYHAGNYPMNQRSIGIEHEDNWNGQPPEPARTDALYAASGRLVRDICTFYNIPLDRTHILKHKEVSDKPTACPDQLDIDRIIREAQGVAPIDPCKETIANLNGQIADKNRKLEEAASEVSSANTQLTIVQGVADSLKQQADQLPVLRKQLDQAENDRRLALDAQESMNKQIGQLRNSSYLTVSTNVLLKEVAKRILHVK